MTPRARIFVALVAVCVLGGGAFVAVAALRADKTDSEAAARASATLPEGVRVLVRAVDAKDPRLNGRVAQLGAGAGARPGGGALACQRVHFAAGQGVCLALAPSGVDYEARLFDRDLRVTRTLALPGLPSRTRVSRDGRYAATTTFVSGDAYAAPGTFSTRTGLIDLRSGERMANLEDYAVTRDGETIDSIDFNFWGVTFARDSNRFYATLGTGDRHYLIEGDVRERTARVVAKEVECPSLSPDERRIGFKQPLGEGRWRFSVLDLDTGARHELSEERSIDDQLEWLDDERLLYGDGRSVWLVRADGEGKPVRIASRADSPAVLR